MFTPNQKQAFSEAAKPMVKWLNENMHPHVKVIVTPDGAELMEGVLMDRGDGDVQDKGLLKIKDNEKI